MYQDTGELKKISKFKVKYTSGLSNQSSSTIKVQVRCQSLTVEIKFKCDDLDHQVSITNS